MKYAIICLIIFFIIVGYFVSNFNEESNFVLEKESSSSSKISTDLPLTVCDYKNLDLTYANTSTEGTIISILNSYHQKNITIINNDIAKHIENNYPQLSNANLIGFRKNNLNEESFNNLSLSRILKLSGSEFSNTSYLQFAKTIICDGAKVMYNDIYNFGSVEGEQRIAKLKNLIIQYNELELSEESEISDPLYKPYQLQNVFLPDLYLQINEVIKIN